ncbi:DNA-binding death effector domain-containing protein 2 [Dromaius novaehollandiae]|uniref:DNA-binding death effector domain-containing protein 2 n=1 Tax=Dromaius novaehollandiae TaxID=8790 RepID=UPI00311FAC13
MRRTIEGARRIRAAEAAAAAPGTVRPAELLRAPPRSPLRESRNPGASRRRGTRRSRPRFRPGGARKASAVESLRALSQLHSLQSGPSRAFRRGAPARPGSRSPAPMAEPRPPPPAWEEDECLEYYGLLSLHRLFEVIGAQLTENDVAVLSFLLQETPPGPHPLDPALWAEEGAQPPAPLLERWRRRRRPRRAAAAAGGGGRRRAGGGGGGVELLLELERRGLCDESNLRHLLQLLRVLTRHDLLPYASLKRPRTVSPERYTCGPSVGADRRVDSCLDAASAEPRQEHWDAASTSGKRKRASRGRTRANAPGRRRRRGGAAAAPAPQPETPAKVTCDIRLRVRAEYCEHEPALRQSVASNKRHRLERQLDVFGQASAVLKARDLGAIICDIKFSELSYLDAFWGDYLNGSLLRALRGVFLTEALREAVGREAVRLLVSVDEDDYERGRRLLLRAPTDP